MLLWRAIGMACLLLGVSPVYAQPAPGPGTVVSDFLVMNDKSIPLPQGKWTVVSVQSHRSSTNNPISRLFLADANDRVLSRWIYVATNAEYNRGGWKRDQEICDRKNVHYGYSDSVHNPNEAECWIVNHWGMTLGRNPSQTAIDFYRWSDGLHRPNTSVGVAYFFAKRGDFFNLEVQYNPVVDGFRDTSSAIWRGNPWHADVASKDPKKLEYLRALKAMGEQYFQQLKTVLH